MLKRRAVLGLRQNSRPFFFWYLLYFYPSVAPESAKTRKLAHIRAPRAENVAVNGFLTVNSMSSAHVPKCSRFVLSCSRFVLIDVLQHYIVIGFAQTILEIYCYRDLLSAFDSVHQSDFGSLFTIVFQTYRIRKLSGIILSRKVSRISIFILEIPQEYEQSWLYRIRGGW